MPSWQRTLARPAELAGVGLHSGVRVHLRLHPADANTGVVFRLAATGAEVRAHVSYADATRSRLCTQLGAVSTVEHLMAALAAARVTNAFVDVSGGSELPILDGSSLPFADAVDVAGVHELVGDAQRALRVERPVQALLGDKAAWLLPLPRMLGAAPVAVPTLHARVQVNFAHKGLGTTERSFTLGADADANRAAFRAEIAPARTFTFEDEIAQLRSLGLARGGSLANAVVFRDPAALDPAAPVSARVMNAEGLRFPRDEWTRHKLLDCVGDLALAGLPLHGFFFATSPGHALTHALLRTLLSDPANFSEVEIM
ncbi:hypothetical protein PybrP1_006399 [[Pythium] brassicae (nom. inval.)]|nr:hypothetical protein PybrP1_006399 [[Pythium] brassicae (nom. inval.)]